MLLLKIYWWSTHPILACLKILSLFSKDSFAGYIILVDSYFSLVSGSSCYSWKVSCPQTLGFVVVVVFVGKPLFLDCIFSLTTLPCRFIMFYMDVDLNFYLAWDWLCFLNSWFTSFTNFEKLFAFIFLIIAFLSLHSFPIATNLGANNNKNSFFHRLGAQIP